MGQIPETNAYKLLGNVGSSVQCTAISSSLEGLKCFNQVRQQNGLSIHKPSGGHKSSQLFSLTMDLWKLALQNDMSLKAVYIMGKKNVLADSLSRKQILATELSLNRAVVAQVFKKWGQPMIDLFATFQNKKTPCFAHGHIIHKHILWMLCPCHSRIYWFTRFDQHSFYPEF